VATIHPVSVEGGIAGSGTLAEHMLSTLVEGKTRWTFRFSTGAKAIGRFSILRVRPTSDPGGFRSMCEAAWHFTHYVACRRRSGWGAAALRPYIHQVSSAVP